jgi:hypothetical protein
MPPHRDSLDGPVVKAAIRALEEAHVELVLPFVKPDEEDEVREAFERVTAARSYGGAAREVAALRAPRVRRRDRRRVSSARCG